MLWIDGDGRLWESRTLDGVRFARQVFSEGNGPWHQLDWKKMEALGFFKVP